MKNLSLVLALATSSLLFSCKEPADNTEAIKRMEDTLFKSYPTMAGVSVEVKDNSVLNIVVRSAQLYSTSTENKQKVSGEINDISKSVFGTNNELEKGEVIFTRDERNTDMNPQDAERFPMTFPHQ